MTEKSSSKKSIMQEMLDDSIEKWGGRESSKVEYKASISRLSSDVWETVSAFSNEGGGVILLGYEEVNDSFKPVGVKNPAQMLDDFTSAVGPKFNFCPLVNADILEDQGVPVILIEVKEALKYQKPIYVLDAGPIKGGHKRVGATDIRLTDSDVQRYYHERMGAPDAQVLPHTSIKDIDEGTLSSFRNLRKLIKPEAPELVLDDEGLLRSYSLISQEGTGLTVAGLLLFGKKEVVKRHFPALRLDVIRIKGTEWGREKDPFLSKDLFGNLIIQWSAALDMLDRFFLVPFKLGENLARIEDHPHSKAVREALTNLLMHQNFFHSSPSQIRIYNDRVEFYNPGYSLKDPATYDSPGSELRNSLIASVFYDIGWAETKGTGLMATAEMLEKEGFPVPEYHNNKKADTFTLILEYPSQALAEQVTPQVTPQVEMMDRIALTLNYCEIPRSRKEIMVFLNLKDRKHLRENIIRPLINEGLLKRTRPDKPTSRFQKYVTVKDEDR